MPKKNAASRKAYRAVSGRYARRGSGKSASLHAKASGEPKQKVSVTLDASLLAEVRTFSGKRPLSATINDLLTAALAQRRLAELVAELEAEAGPAPMDAYQRLLDQWEQGAAR